MWELGVFPCGLRVRHIQVFMLFLSLCVNYMMRVNISIALVLMTDLNSTSSAKVFDWSVAEQSTAQSVFFIGYFFMNLVAAVLVTRYSNKYILLTSTSTTAAATLATPFLVTFGGYYSLIGIRVLMGIMQGCMMACVMGLMSRWVPIQERARCGSLVLGGMHLGNLLSFSVSGWIGSNYGGWPAIYYYTGTVAAIWCLAWTFIGADSAETCNYISTEEKKFINEQLAETSLPSDVPVPWKKIVTNKACWAILFGTIGNSWGTWTLVAAIPSYLKSVLHFSATLDGIITSLPYGCLWLASFPVSYISDYIVRKRILSVTACRKMFNSLGFIGAAVCLIILGSTTHEELTIAMYIAGVTMQSCAYIGFNINHLDIIPNFAGFLMGLTNGFANVASISAPLFVGLIVHDASNTDEWRIVFFVSAAVFVLCNAAFVFMGTAKELECNKIPKGYENKNDSSAPSIEKAYL